MSTAPQKYYSEKQAFDLAMVRLNDPVKTFPTWDDLPDTNSLWDYLCDGMNTSEVERVTTEAYDDRLQYAGYPMEDTE